MGSPHSILSPLDSCEKLTRSKGKTRKKSCLSCDVADGLFGACLESAVTTRLDLTSIALTRDPPLFLGDGDLSDVNSGMRTKDEWVRLLQSGVVVALDGEPVTLTFERESWSIKVCEHGSTYSLATLRDCKRLARTVESAPIELVMTIGGPPRPLVLQFDDETARDTFAATLDELARDARQSGDHRSASSI